MMNKRMDRFSADKKKTPVARLALKVRFSPWAGILPVARFVLTASLMGVLAYAGYRYFFFPNSASALQFTAHLIGKTADSIGVLDVKVGDVTGDGKLDVVTAGTKGVAVYAQGSKYSFVKKMVDDSAATRVQLVDLDNDGVLDLLASLKNSPGVKWYQNNGAGSFTGHNLTTGGPGVAAAGDLDRDGNKDIATAVQQNGEVVVQRWMGNGSGSFTATTLNSNSGVKAIVVGDVNGNQYPDIVTGGTSGLQRWDTSNGSTWSRTDIDDAYQNKSSIVIYDVNGDDKADILTADQDKNTTVYYRNLDNSAYERIVLDGDTDTATVVGIDLDADKTGDVVTAAQDDNSLFWYENDGSDSFTKRTLVTNLQSVYGVAVVDINGDSNLDLVAGDHFRGDLYWYERVRARPLLTVPENIQESTSGRGLITFQSTISSADFNPTRLRAEYSLDGKTWFKPWLTKVTPSVGAADLNNNNQYQLGSSDAIDTNSTDTITLSFTWDTKSDKNTGGSLSGKMADVRLRLTARDSVTIGAAVTSDQFRVDNIAPANFGSVQVVGAGKDQIQLSWSVASDASGGSYVVYYGTDASAVAKKQSKSWSESEDSALSKLSATGTTIGTLDPDATYTLKVFAKDIYGNEVGAPAVTAKTSGTASLTSPSPTTSGEPTPITSTSPSVAPSSEPSATPTPTALPTTQATPPPTTFQNHVPKADAGPEQVVNPNATVILDGTASSDADGDVLSFVWRQLSGPAVELLSARTATPSFSAGDENQTYIFSLTVRDPKGATATDIVTVATRNLPAGNTTPVNINHRAPDLEVVEVLPAYEQFLLRPINYVLFILAILATIVSIVDHITRRFGDTGGGTALSENGLPKGKVVHYKTGEAIAGAQVTVYGADGKLKSSFKTSAKGEFETLFPAGQYTIGVQAEGFTFAPMATSVLKPENGILYSGGTLTVQDGTKPITIIIPMKPTGEEVSLMRVRVLHFWQSVQRLARVLSWPVFLLGTFLNTTLIFLRPGILYLVIEVFYVLLVIVKVILEVRVRPAYGLVRDAITHVPLDLSVVRLYEEGTNRLVMTRVTNGQGKFFALPPSGSYAISVTKPGYATFTKQNLVIASEQDSVLQITTDLMPVTPQMGLSAARAAVL